MEHSNLKLQLEHLQKELDKADQLDDESRQHLLEIHEDIERLLERQTGGDEYHRFLSKLHDAYSHFEVSHPGISGAITRVMDGIASLGI